MEKVENWKKVKEGITNKAYETLNKKQIKIELSFRNIELT